MSISIILEITMVLFSPSKFRLYIETTLFRKNQQITIITAKRLVSHRCVCHVHMNSQSFFQGGIAVTSNGLEALYEVDLFRVFRQGEFVPY